MPSSNKRLAYKGMGVICPWAMKYENRAVRCGVQKAYCMSCREDFIERNKYLQGHENALQFF